MAQHFLAFSCLLCFGLIFFRVSVLFQSVMAGIPSEGEEDLVLKSPFVSTQEMGVVEGFPDQAEDDVEDNFEADLSKEFGEEELKEYINDIEKMPALFACESDKENLPENVVQSSLGKSVAFLELDEELVKEVHAAGRKFDKIEWARTRFDAWRIKRNLPVDKKIEELDLRDFSRMLEQFMLQVCKIKGGLYPTETLQDIFRKFGAIIRRAQEVRIGITGVEEIAFDIRYSPIFSNARKACIASMRRSRLTPGICGKRKKVEEISFATEQALLADIDHSVHSVRGLQRRFMFYCVSRFAIRGREELYKLVVNDFHVLNVDGAECLEYSERLSKNYDVSMTKYQEESFRLPMKCYELDVIFTFKCLLRHLPVYEENEKAERFVFMQAINSPKSDAWYNKKHRVSAKVLGGWMKYMLRSIGVEGNFSGKSGRSSVVSRLARANVPIDVGMTVTGHRNPESYKRYDKTNDLRAKAAMSIVGQPFNADGSRRMFDDVYKSELGEYDVKQNSGSFNVLQNPSDTGMKPEAAAAKVIEDVSSLTDNTKTDMKVVVAQTSSDLDDDFFDNIPLEELAGQNQRLRRAFNLNVDIGSTSITGGTFSNCIILPGGGSFDLGELVKKIMK